MIPKLRMKGCAVRIVCRIVPPADLCYSCMRPVQFCACKK